MSFNELVADVLTNYAVAWQGSDGAECFGIAMELFNLIERHVAEAVAREREECAKVCESQAARWSRHHSRMYVSYECAAIIRARAEKETK